MTRSFRVDIPPHHVADVRKKLRANQRHKAPQDQVRYSSEHKTFWRWVHYDNKWRMLECSRNGNRVGEFFGHAYDEVRFKRSMFGIASYRAEKTETVKDASNWLPPGFNSSIADEVKARDGALEMPQFLPLNGGGAVACRSEKLSILLWIAAHPADQSLMVAVSGIGWTTASELRTEGLIEFSPRGYALTDRGRVFVEHLTKQPLPVQVQQWEMPT